ncbi:hypothetical protein SCLCIDRAFT_121591 [Scleroderma citrinum Foug A]|uniref:Reverse transcriptase Ty1/copia-type domain-containing protein n=1 Tax=Scleroderma citrinum Foug A TaxID=1036808 RepID=A0A0C3DZK3_9AGAM|nr:hypothetical protein SCLCIDRAFT_121591 [Scleroderma citrinum Foug A]
MVFKVKRNADGSIDHYKAQLVAKGYNQHPGFDYLQVFAPTVCLSSIRVILTLAALQDLHLHSLDVSHAYLNGEMDCEVYMAQPEGFVEGDPKAKVCLLQKAIYGSKQGGNCWNKKIIYIYFKDDLDLTVTIILPVFVDDITLASKSAPAIQSFIAQLSQHFKIHNLGPITQLLGIKIDGDHSKHSISLSQRYPQNAQEAETMHQTPYLSATGALMYLATTTHPDITYTVGVLARLNSNPGWTHWLTVKHLLRYIKGTIDYSITYSPDSAQPETFIMFSDADHGGCKDTGHSTGGDVVKMGTGVVSWSSKLQNVIALSTTEADSGTWQLSNSSKG